MRFMSVVTWPQHVVSRSAAVPLAQPGILEALSNLAGLVAVVAMLGTYVVAASPVEPASNETERVEGEPSTLAPPTREMMFAGYVGAPYTYPSDVTIKKEGQHDFTAKDVPWQAKPFISPIYYGARIVRWYGEKTGAMVDFTHSKALARLNKEVDFTGTINGAPAPERAKLEEIFRRLEASHGHNMLTVNGLYRLPSLGSRLFPYVGIGVGVNLPHSEVQLVKDPTRTYEYQYTGPVAQAVIGLEFRIPRMSYFFEYKFSLASYQMPLTGEDGTILFVDLWRQFKRWWSGEAPIGGYLWTRYTSHQGIAGLGVRVPAAP